MRRSNILTLITLITFSLPFTYSVYCGGSSDSPSQNILPVNATVEYVDGDNLYHIIENNGQILGAGVRGVYEFDTILNSWTKLYNISTSRIGFFNSKWYFLNNWELYTEDNSKLTKISIPDIPWGFADVLVEGQNIYLASYGHNHDWSNIPSEGKGIYFSNDYGHSWAQINTGLVHLNVSKIKKSKDGNIYCSTYGGFYKLDQVNKEWKNMFLVNDGQDDVIISDFDFLYGGSNSPEKIYLTTSGMGLAEYTFSTDELFFFDYVNSWLGYSIHVNQESSSIVTSHWINGIKLWDTTNMTHKTFLENTVWSTCGILYNGEIISVAYGGYLSAFITDVNTMVSTLCSTGLSGFHNIRCAIRYNGRTYFGSTSGLLVRSSDNTDYFMTIIDPDRDFAIDEVMDFKVDDNGDLYFLTFGSGLWKYISIDNAQKISLSEPGNSANAGDGTRFELLNDKVYLSKSRDYLGKTGGFQAYDLSTGDMLYYADGLPSHFYGMRSNFIISFPEVLFTLHPESSTTPSLYLSVDEGRNFTFIDNISHHSIGIYGDQYFYIKEGYLCTVSKSLLNYQVHENIPSQAMFIHGDYLFVIQNGRIILYNPINLKYLGTIDQEFNDFKGNITITENEFAIIANPICFISFSDVVRALKPATTMPWIPLLLLKD